jgi:hypothetical protein
VTDPETEARALLAAITRAPWYVNGTGPQGWFVMSKGAANGSAPLVALVVEEADADLISRAPEIIQALMDRQPLSDPGSGR